MNNDDYFEGNWKFEGYIGFIGVVKFVVEKVFFLDSVILLGFCYWKVNGFLVRLKS